ncbi:MAG: SPOR domain-containing protein [Deltaproteobacteria bacterium]|nr:SPOR domain-containing protein [Deltaproteobacteria bacterium]MBI3062529.1 SPOR domain-containing protein [Deltaproteobacteria bacterium]
MYYWTRGQLLGLAIAFAAASAVVFFLGILIGQGIEERKLLKKEEPLIKIPAQPLSQGGGTTTAGKEEMTFYEELAKKGPSAPPATRLEPAKETKAAEKAAKPATKETKAPAQEVKIAPAEKVKTAEKVKEKRVAEKSAPAAEATREAPAKKAAEPKETATSVEAREKVWAVQVNAFPFERDAKGLAKKLRDKGYDAYVVPTNIKGKDWYRVRVGRFKTQEEAKTLQDTLKTREKFTKSITTSR